MWLAAAKEILPPASECIKVDAGTAERSWSDPDLSFGANYIGQTLNGVCPCVGTNSDYWIVRVKVAFAVLVAEAESCPVTVIV